MAGIFFAHPRLAVVVLVVLTFLSSSIPSAQVATGSIVGTVTDSSGQVVPGAQVMIREVNRRGASNFNALGSQANSNAWMVDGIDNNEFTFNTFIVMPSVEQVREFEVLTGVFSAEFGRGAGVVSVSSADGSWRASRP